MIKPVRLQLSRQKGFNLQAHSRATNGLTAVNCARPSKWGNPWKAERRSGRWFVEGPGVSPLAHPCGNEEGAALVAINHFRREVERRGVVSELRGNNLACWCALDASCHVDVLLELANGEAAA